MFAEHKTYATHGMEQPRFPSAVQLTPQMRDVNINHVVEGRDTWCRSPDITRQHVASYDHTLIAHQISQ